MGSWTATQSIRVLHLDDEPDFADMASAFLKREDDRFDVHTARTAKEGIVLLDSEEFDCVISDHDMPEQTGIEFLQAVRKQYPDLPFILFTGKGSEEIAGEAISAGVTDYLQKGSGTDQYSVLANRVRNLVEKYRAEQEAARTRSRLEAITANSSDAILTIDTGSTIQFANAAVKQLFGYDSEGLIGESLTTIIPPQSRDDHIEGVARYVKTGERTLNWDASEFAAQHRDGHEIPVSVSFSEYVEDGERRFVGIIRDITNRVRMEEKLREREQKFRQMAENIDEVVWMSDPEKEEVFYVSPAYEDIWERSVTDFNEDATSFLDAVHPDDRDWAEEALATQAVGEYDEEYRIVRPDGEVRWIRDQAVPVKSESGEVYRIVGIASDISEQKEREQEYERVVDLLEHTERIADVGGWEIDTNTQDVFWSDYLFEMLGVEHGEEPPLEEVLDMYVAEDRPRVADAVEKALSGGERIDVEARFERADGAIRWFQIQGEPIVEDGDVVKLRGAVHDITELKNREHKLEALNREIPRLLSAETTEEVAKHGVNAACEILDLQANSIHLYDPENNELAPVAYTDSILELIGDPPTFRNGESIAWRVFADGTATAIDNTRADQDVYNPETPIRSELLLPLGEYGILMAGSPTPSNFNSQDVTLGEILAAHITTALSQVDTEQELRERESELEAQNERLEQFTSMVSHDLRNPLAVASGNLELYQETGDESLLEPIETSLTRIQELVTDLTALARHDISDENHESISVTEVARDAWELIDTRSATLTTEPCTVSGDTSQLRTLFENLFRNAVGHGGADVIVRVGSLENGFYVEDTGDGIPSEERDSVFDHGYTTGYSGSGTGLTIVSRIAQAHNWDVTLTDSNEGGARFEFRASHPAGTDN